MKKTLLLAIFLLPTFVFATIDSNLKYGSRGLEVTELQEFLIDKGFLTGQPTGNFFALTKKAVIAYQKSVALPQTGFVGPMTRQMINQELAVDENVEIQETGKVEEPIKTSQTDVLKTQIDTLITEVKALKETKQESFGSVRQTPPQQVIPDVKKTIRLTVELDGYKKIEAGKKYRLGVEFYENDRPISNKYMPVSFTSSNPLDSFVGGGDNSFRIPIDDTRNKVIEDAGCPTSWDVGSINTKIYTSGSKTEVHICPVDNLARTITVTGNGTSTSFVIGGK